MSYSGLPIEEGGADLRPDIAAGPPTVSDDGLTWTFRLKRGLHFGPPFADTEIVAADVVRAVERLGRPGSLPPEDYSYLYDVIEGFAAFRDGEATSIKGLETPDPYTLVVRLSDPISDLPDRFGLPGTAPVPEGATTDRPEDYIRYLVSSGPYMIEGSERLDFSVPRDEQEPVSGFVPPVVDDEHNVIQPGSISLVRNPSWDPASDDLRSAYVDTVELDMFDMPSGFGVAADIAEKRAIAATVAEQLAGGELDVSHLSLGRSAVEAYEREPGLRDRISTTPRSLIYYIPLRLGLPPLDDIHVRKAIALALDRRELLRLYEEGDRFGQIAWHLALDVTERGLLTDYQPTWMSASEGDLDAARAEMRQSAYDDDGDGVCDDSVCRNVPSIDYEGQSVARLIREDLREIGITFSGESLEPPARNEGWDTLWAATSSTSEHVGTVLVQWWAWGFDYPNASSVFVPLADSSQIGSFNFALLGASASQLREWDYPVSSVPSVDDRIERCQSLSGADQPACWSELDTYLMEDVVPWVPLFFENVVQATSPRVATYSYDSARDFPALDQISLVPGSE